MKVRTLIYALFTWFLMIVGYGGSVVTVSTASESTLDDNTLQFVSIQSVQDLIIAHITPPLTTEDRIPVAYALISPDGKRIIVERSSNNGLVLCTYLFETDATTCTDMGKLDFAFLGGWWSPDNRYLVLNLDVFAAHHSYEIDIWIYDTQENILINRTDDGIAGHFSSIEATENMLIDIAPVWSPNGDLYFFRNRIDPLTTEWRADLMRIPAEDILGTSDPEMILHHPSDYPLGIYRLITDWLDSTMTISPDGQYLAYSAMSSSLNDESNGVWIIDLAQKSVKARLPYERFMTVINGVPEWWGNYIETWTTDYSISRTVPRNLTWSADSNTLVTLPSYARLGPAFVPFMKYDVSADTLQAIYDYSGLEVTVDIWYDTYFDDFALSVDSQVSMAIASPTHKTVFYMGRNAQGAVLSAMNITETGFTTPVRIHTFTDLLPKIGFPSIGDDGTVVRIIAFGELITLASP